MTRGYLISEGLKDKIHSTIERVAGMPYGGGVTNVTPRLETLVTTKPPQVFRIATFTGAWAINSSKTVTFKYATNTPNTVSATNLFFPAAPASDCGIAKDGTAWFLVSVPMTQVSVITSVALGTAGLQFTRAMLSVASTSTHSSVTIGTTACT